MLARRSTREPCSGGVNRRLCRDHRSAKGEKCDGPLRRGRPLSDEAVANVLTSAIPCTRSASPIPPPTVANTIPQSAVGRRIRADPLREAARTPESHDTGCALGQSRFLRIDHRRSEIIRDHRPAALAESGESSPPVAHCSRNQRHVPSCIGRRVRRCKSPGDDFHLGIRIVPGEIRSEPANDSKPSPFTV